MSKMTDGFTQLREAVFLAEIGKITEGVWAKKKSESNFCFRTFFHQNYNFIKNSGSKRCVFLVHKFCTEAQIQNLRSSDWLG